MKVLFLTNIPSPYMVDFFNELGKLCSLTVVFERENSGVRNDSWKKFSFVNFSGIILKGKNIKVNDELDDQAISPQVLKYIKKNVYDAIIVANPCTPTGIMAIFYMKFRRIPYIIQSEGGFPKNGKGIKEKLKKIIMRNANLYLSTAELGDKYFIQYGADINRIRRFPFTSLFKNEILTKPIPLYEKSQLRKKLGIPYSKMIISVGRFIPVKGFDTLIKACAGIDKNIGIYFIGGEPTKEYISIKHTYAVDNLHFISHMDKDSIKEYYKAADFFILNSRGDTWGLVINEAMSFGLPIISSNKCYAALALIENGENGYIVPVDNEREINNKIKYLINNPGLCEVMSQNNINKMQNYTLEEMARREIEILNESI